MSSSGSAETESVDRIGNCEMLAAALREMKLDKAG
jgi:hypothetical protein